ncbi:putative glutamate--cysteine ligase 2 [Sinomonas cyclohexanicum]|uniref:Putative glutamate--cysteine ligase 2 n=1 Tax=Sinomonas cyclohexanicum TaxID=322009 RepID=A0ABM7PRT8_SINCY|nr:putative glutamate--cysteine ligase 2 [Corynebacterium cyclohexanicum]
MEEELLLLDPLTGRPTALADQVLKTAGRPDTLDYEFKLDQIEVQTRPCGDHDGLLREIIAGRRLADSAARALGARAVPLATSPLGSPSMLAPGLRFARISDEYGITAEEQLTCALHVHVHVNCPEEGVAVLDRIRDWLPLLIALSANSPFWHGRDTGYASFRTQAWNRWPTAGPRELYGTLGAYRAAISAMTGTGVAFDEGMAYFDARLSAKHPTVEIRVADVPLVPEDSALIAVVARALVETAAREAAHGAAPLAQSVSSLRLAAWRASRSGLAGDLIHPMTGVPVPAAEAIDALLCHLAPVLREGNELALAEAGIAALFDRGTGERAQRRAAARTGLRSIADLAASTVDEGGEVDDPDLARERLGDDHLGTGASSSLGG